MRVQKRLLFLYKFLQTRVYAAGLSAFLGQNHPSWPHGEEPCLALTAVGGRSAHGFKGGQRTVLAIRSVEFPPHVLGRALGQGTRGPAGTVAVCLWRDTARGCADSPCDLLTCWQAVTRAALGCPGAMPGGLCCGSVVQAEQADPSCGGGAQSAGVMPSWRHKKQEKAEVTRSKKTWCLGLGGGQPPAGERL